MKSISPPPKDEYCKKLLNMFNPVIVPGGAAFAADAVHEVLKDHGKGTEAIITKLAAQRGKKLVTTYDVQIVGNGKVDSSESNAVPNQNNPTDKYLTIMEECFEHASRIQKRFNSVNLNQIAITLFIQKSKAIGLTN